jgi:hypothetical protein
VSSPLRITTSSGASMPRRVVPPRTAITVKRMSLPMMMVSFPGLSVVPRGWAFRAGRRLAAVRPRRAVRPEYGIPGGGGLCRCNSVIHPI